MTRRLHRTNGSLVPVGGIAVCLSKVVDYVESDGGRSVRGVVGRLNAVKLKETEWCCREWGGRGAMSAAAKSSIDEVEESAARVVPRGRR